MSPAWIEVGSIPGFACPDSPFKSRRKKVDRKFVLCCAGWMSVEAPILLYPLV